MLSKQEIAGLRELLAKATPGPWHTCDDNDDSQRPLWAIQNPAFDSGPEDDPAFQAVINYGGKSDAELIAAMHRALPALLDIAEAVARAEIVDAEEDGFISTYAPMNAKRVLVLPLAGEVANG